MRYSILFTAILLGLTLSACGAPPAAEPSQDAAISGSGDEVLPTPAQSGSVVPEEAKTPDVASILENPIEGTEVTVEGEVSQLGELSCPCFTLRSGEKGITVWYDGMTGDPASPWTRVDIAGITNGDRVMLRGELHASPGTIEKVLWIRTIITHNGGVRSLPSPDECRQICSSEGFPESACETPQTSSAYGVDRGACTNPSQVCGERGCRCYCREAAPTPGGMGQVQQLTVKEGAFFDIVLASNPTTGYKWEAAFDMEQVILTKSSFVSPDVSGIVGAPGKQSFTFRALGPGKVRIVFAYKRPWDGGPPVNSMVYEVTVE